MQQSLQQKLRGAQEYSQALQANFNNNLRVIEQFEQENESLRGRVAQLEQQNQSLREEMVREQQEGQFQKRIMQNQSSARVEEKQREMQEVVVMLEAKYRRQIEAISHKFNNQLKSIKLQLIDREESMRRMLTQNGQLCTTISDLKQRRLNLQQEVASLNREKDAMSSTMKLHEQQLNGISSSHKVWQETLRQRIEVIKEDKRKIQQSFAEYKMIASQKIKRQKDDLARTLQKMADKQEQRFRETALEQKQLNFNLEKVTAQLKESRNQIQRLKEQKNKMEVNMTKYQQHEKAYVWNQKERAQLQQMLEQQKRDFQLQVKELTEKLKEQQAKLQKVNARRQQVEKAVQRMKVELINKAKEIEQLKKTVSKFQQRLKENQQQQAEQMQPEAINSFKPQRAYDSKGFDFVQSVNIQNDYSKVYTDDPGVIDSKYFQQNPTKSPKHINHSPKANRQNINRQAQLMKQVSQIQLQLQDVKMANRRFIEDIESLRRMVDDRNKQISVLKDKANIYWQKANDKEQQCNSLKEINNELRTNCSELNQQIRRYKQSQSQLKSKEQQFFKMKQTITHLQNEIKELNAEIQMLTKDRDLMEQISSDLRAENHTLKEMIEGNDVELEQNSYMKSQQEQNKSQQQFRQREVQMREEETMPFFQPERLKFPKKLHDLVRQKKILSISGKRAAMEQRQMDTRFDQMHAGTDSQKVVYQRIKQKNKTPPKVANYYEMKKEKQRRSHQLQTVSQKQVFERLKSRQNIQVLNPPSPQRGVNYLQLRQLGAQ